MEIVINGKKVKMADVSLSTIISQYQINPNNCIVDLNGKFISKEDFSHTQVKEGDRLELIRFIGGG